ncbi:unnamed protein product [Prorocentrum cordatum]|uniref:Uncharacterized protein n=1 Tax=Prorocentrum cordatum TaxID=2364126 RepID=A0ABN9QG75_9DINO|nr:unnamed protein product [Polarella glacialis]
MPPPPPRGGGAGGSLQGAGTTSDDTVAKALELLEKACLEVERQAALAALQGQLVPVHAKVVESPSAVCQRCSAAERRSRAAFEQALAEARNKVRAAADMAASCEYQVAIAFKHVKEERGAMPAAAFAWPSQAAAVLSLGQLMESEDTSGLALKGRSSGASSTSRTSPCQGPTTGSGGLRQRRREPPDHAESCESHVHP